MLDGVTPSFWLGVRLTKYFLPSITTKMIQCALRTCLISLNDHLAESSVHITTLQILPDAAHSR